MALELPYGIRPVVSKANVDERYGPYNSISEALTGTAGTRERGLTVGVIENDSVVEYWFKDGIADADLIIKTTVKDIAEDIHNAIEKTTLVDADEFGIWDSVSSALRKVTWANIKTTLKTYFDSIYATISEAGLWEPETISAATTEHPRWGDSVDPDIYGIDKFGFGALPSGYRKSDGTYFALGQYIQLWSSTDNAGNPFYKRIENSASSIFTNNIYKNTGQSIRLVRPYTIADGDKIDGRVLSNDFTDFDGNSYDGVIIGDQVWLTSNLKTTSYNNGDPITTGLNDTDWSNAVGGAYAVYDYTLVTGIDSEDEMIAAYGLLYNWYAVDDSRGLGDGIYVVPTDAQFTQLTDYIIANYPEIDSSNVGDYLKSVRQVNSPFEADSDEIIRPKKNLDGNRRKALPNDIKNLLGAPKKLKKINDAGDDLEDTPFDYDQVVQVADIDMSDVDVGESKILLAQKQSDGSAVFKGSVAQIDKIAPPELDTLLAPDQSGWVGDEITLSGDNTLGVLGVNSQEFYNDEDWFLCISHTDTSATWKRNRGQDCLNIGESTADAIIAELETESGWNTTANFKQITTKSKKGSWFRRDTGGYLYMCIDNSNGWIRVGTPDTYTLEISSSSHPTLTTNLDTHDFTTNGWYDETSDGTNETAIQGQMYVDYTNENIYRRLQNNMWAKIL